ncbi:MAG: hypothetical protein M3Z66_09670 [Chloroflexota bacterium]|nr:hypothetical protein [Chloroflexota bacterium]
MTRRAAQTTLGPAMSEFTWYSRLAVWAGVAVLLVQSASGRSVGLMTVTGVLLLAAGLVFFIGGLLADARRPLSMTPDRAETPAATGAGPEAARRKRGVQPAAPPPSELPEDRTERAHVDDVTVPEPPVPGEAPEAAPEPSLAAAVVSLDTDPGARVAADRVETRELAEGDAELTATCTRCGRVFEAGQVVAVCPRCAQLHHASCWIDHRFHCSHHGCEGRGSLEAPNVRGEVN